MCPAHWDKLGVIGAWNKASVKSEVSGSKEPLTQALSLVRSDALRAEFAQGNRSWIIRFRDLSP